MTQPTHFQIISPADGSVYAERPSLQLIEATSVTDRSRQAQQDWAQRSIAERAVNVIIRLRPGQQSSESRGDNALL